MKFYVRVLHLEIHTKFTKLLHKKLLDQKSCTSFQEFGHIRLTWPMFDIILFSPVEEMGFYHQEMKFYVRVLHFEIHTTCTKLLHKKLLDQKSCTSFQNGGHIRLTWPMFDIILFFTRLRDGILPSRDEVLHDSLTS